MSDKIFKTHRQQLKILRDRGMSIDKDSQGSKVMRILEKENYYSVVNGYKDPFIIPGAIPETYAAGTSFDNLYSLFCFDRNVRSIYLKYILKAEHQIKAVIAHEFSKKYGHDNYLKLENFDNRTDNIQNVLATIGKLQNALSNKMGKSNEITHYMSQYGYVPLWVLVNILTLGEMSHFYANMKASDKNQVAHQFLMRPKELEKYIWNLTIARNLCAHDERFYDVVFKNSLAISTIPRFNIFGIPTANGNPSYGTKDVFSIAVILALLLTKNDTREFVAAMDKEFSKLRKVLPSATTDNIMLKMGFGPNWKKIIEIK